MTDTSLTPEEIAFVLAVLQNAPYTGKPDDLRGILALVERITAKLTAQAQAQ